MSLQARTAIALFASITILSPRAHAQVRVQKMPAAAAQATKQQPPDVQAQSKPLTRNQVMPAWLARLNSQSVDAFGSLAPEPWRQDAKAIAFLNAVSRYRVGYKDAPSEYSLVAMGRALVEDRNCPDLLIRTQYLVLAADKLRNLGFSPRALAAAQELALNTTYPWETRGVLALQALAVQDQQQRPAAAKEVAGTAVSCFTMAASEPGLAPLQARELFSRVERLINGSLPSDLAQQLVDSLRKAPKADPWLVEMCDGVLQIRLAWDARGRGSAKSVTQAGWRLFESHLARSRACLERAYALDPTRPEAAANMLTLVRAGAADKSQSASFWFDRANRAQSDWVPAYHNMLTALLPRWGGDADKMLDFGMLCAAGDYKTLAPFWYVRSIAWAGEDAGLGPKLFKNPQVYDGVHTLIAKLRRSPENADALTMLDCADAAAAWHAKRYPDARTILQRATAYYDSDIRMLMQADPEDVIRDAFTLGTGDATIRAGIDALSKSDWPVACKSFQTALDATPATEPLRARALRDRLAAATVLADLQKGEWSSLSFAKNLPGWRQTEHPGWGGYAKDSTPAPSGPGTYSLFLDPVVGPRWSMRATIDVPEGSPQTTGADFVVGFVIEGRGSTGKLTNATIQCCPAGGRVNILSTRGNTEKRIEKTALAGAKVRVNVFDRRVILFLNDHAVLDSTIPSDPDWNPGDTAAFHLVYSTKNDLSVRLKDVQVSVLRQVTQVDDR